MPNKPSDYEQGARNGRTAATLETVQDSVDAVMVGMRGHAKTLATLTEAMKGIRWNMRLQWGMILLLIAAIGTLGAMILK